MSSRYLKNNNKTKARKGISPVIATVILVAVAVVIAAALAGFSSSLFGSYSQNSQIQIRSVTMNAAGDGTLDIVNKGASAETVQKVSMNVGGTTYVYTLDPATDNPTIEANSDNSATPTEFDFSDAGNTTPAALPGTAIDPGQTISIIVQTQSGQQYTLSTVAQ